MIFGKDKQKYANLITERNELKKNLQEQGMLTSQLREQLKDRDVQISELNKLLEKSSKTCKGCTPKTSGTKKKETK